MPSIPTENPDARQALRNLMRARRAALPARQRLDAGNALAQQLALLPILEFTQTLAGYFACSGELPLRARSSIENVPGSDFISQ